jgi:O-antigen biosynthesis protein
VTLRASVVVIVRNDVRVVRCVEALRAQTLAADDWELIVVDNGSTDGTADSLRRLGIVPLHEPRRGMPYARNRGLAAARGEIVAFTDADCVPAKEWLSELLDAFAPGIAAVGGRIVKTEPRSAFEVAVRELVPGEQRSVQYLPMFPAPYVVTANAAYRRELLLDLDGFDERFFSGADVDMSWRIARAGHRITTCSSAVVSHANRTSAAQHARQFFRYGLGHALLAKKYGPYGRRSWIVNVYPIAGLFTLFLRDVPRCLRRRELGAVTWLRIWLDFLEYVALLAGDLVGAMRFGVRYL